MASVLAKISVSHSECGIELESEMIEVASKERNYSDLRRYSEFDIQKKHWTLKKCNAEVVGKQHD